MMLSKVEAGANGGEDSSSSRLLQDIEEISKALYLHKSPSKALLSSPVHGSKSAGKTRIFESRSKSVNEDLLHKDGKASIWRWKPLKALTHIMNRRFNCCFFLHVHSIEGLPSNFNDLSLCVNWKRKDEVLRTHPARVCQGMAEFDETLMHRCSVYGSMNGPHNSSKYQPKVFLLHASVIGASGLDIGKHWIDLTRLLPLTLGELEEEMRSSGKWTTSFKLMGKAEGALLNVGFGFSVLRNNASELGSYLEVTDFQKATRSSTMDTFAELNQTCGNRMLRRLESVPNNLSYLSRLQSQSLDIKVLDEVFPSRGSEFTRSITFLYQKLDAGKLDNSEHFDLLCGQLEHISPKPCSSPETFGDDIGNECDDTEFTVIEQGVELPTKESWKSEENDSQPFNCSDIETINVAELFKGDETALDEETEDSLKCEVHSNQEVEGMLDDSGYLECDACIQKPTIEGLNSVFQNFLMSESAALDSRDIGNYIDEKNYMKNKTSYKESNMVKSLSLDDVTESVASDFLSLLANDQSQLDLSYDGEPESPRECLLRQFEKEALASSNSIFNFDAVTPLVDLADATSSGKDWQGCSNDVDFSLVVPATGRGYSRVSLSLRTKRNAKMLENLENEALMREWGLNEKAFQNSPRTLSGGFGSPVYFASEKPPELPPLGQGLGPVVWTKNGGFLRTMSPTIFRSATNGGSLIMQVSGPVLLPASMGSSIMEILQCWALAGIEKMSLQAKMMMPLEDITGKTMQQLVKEAASKSKLLERWPMLLHESKVSHDSSDTRIGIETFPSDMISDKLKSCSIYGVTDLKHVSLEDLAFLAVDKIEALSIEGLRIQSGMSNEDATSSIDPQSIGKTSDIIGGEVKLDWYFKPEEFGGVQTKDTDHIDELINRSISLDELMRLDSGYIGNMEEINERISEILTDHYAKDINFNGGRMTRDGIQSIISGRKHGLLGNNFTLALRVQLRDPIRDYETVGASMLALIKVERTFVPLKPTINYTASERSDSKEKDDPSENLVEGGINFIQKEKEIEEENFIPRFNISEVYVAGLNAEPGKQFWGTKMQQQSGYRWLLSSSMGKTHKHPLSKSSSIIKPSLQMMRKGKRGDFLWSISSNVQGAVGKWKELATLNLHVRNPDIVFPN